MLLHHAMGIKERSIERDRVPHDINPLLMMLEEERRNHPTQLLIQLSGISRIDITFLRTFTWSWSDRPSSHALYMAFNPPPAPAGLPNRHDRVEHTLSIAVRFCPDLVPLLVHTRLHSGGPVLPLSAYI